MPDRWKPERQPVGGDPPARICWSLSGGHSVLDRWELDRSPAGGDPSGRICWSPTRRAQCARLLGRDDLPGRGRSSGRDLLGPGSYQAGTLRLAVCLIAGSASTRRAGGGLPAGICWMLPGGHNMLDRWKWVDSQVGYRPLLPVVCFSGRRRTQARPPGNGTRPIKVPVTRMAIFFGRIFFILKTNRYHD